MTFDEIMAPLGAEAFRRDYLGKRPVHIEGGADKFASLMNWSILERLLAVNTLWDTTRMLLVLDKQPVPAAAFASSQPAITGAAMADPSKVKRYVQQGATMVLNDIDQLTPELTSFARTMEEALGGKVQGNLYQSSKRRQGFQAHYDTHDVFAVHCEGEKVWPVFEGRADNPIAHNMFKGTPQEVHEQAKGKLWKEVRMKPGDLLYLPRGQYHYALADDGGCIHIAFGVTYPIGIDLVGYLYERLIADPLCRKNLPQGDPKALAGHLAGLGKQIAAILSEPATRGDVDSFIKSYRYTREPYDLEALLDPASTAYAVKAAGIKLVEQQGRFGLANVETRQAVAVPAEVAGMVAWVLERETFTRRELDSRFADAGKAVLDKFIQDMEGMALIAVRS